MTEQATTRTFGRSKVCFVKVGVSEWQLSPDKAISKTNLALLYAANAEKDNKNKRQALMSFIKRHDQLLSDLENVGYNIQSRTQYFTSPQLACIILHVGKEHFIYPETTLTAIATNFGFKQRKRKKRTLVSIREIRG